MQRVVIDRDFSLPPNRVFSYLAEHEHLGPLFGAKVSRLQDGPGGDRNGVGSIRQLKVGPMPPFEETVTEFNQDELIRYRITRGSPLRDHDAAMHFSPNGAGTHLHYEISFRTTLPGLDRLVARSLKRNLEKGLGQVDAAA